MAETVNDGTLVYDIVSATNHTARVSAVNASLHASNEADIVIPARFTDIASGVEYSVTDMAVSAFAGSAIKSVVFEAPLGIIPQNAFQGCTKLASVILPPSL